MSFSLVQSKTGSVGSANASSVTVTTSATGSGNLLVAFVSVVQTSGVTITAPTGWVQIGTTQGTTSGNGSFAMFYLPNSTSGVTSYIFSFSVSCNAAVSFEEWSGVATSSPLDQDVAQKNAKATSAPTGTTAALAASGELAIWGLGIGASGTLTYSSVTNSYTEDTASNANSSGATMQAEATLFYNTSVGSAATSSGCTMSGAGAIGNTTILAVFKPAAGGGSPNLTVNSSSLSFSAQSGGANPASQNDQLNNTGTATSNWTASTVYGSGSGWLGVSPASGSLGAGLNTSIAFSCTTGSLSPGTYTATTTFSDGTSSASVSVTFTVGPILATSPASLSFSATVGGANPASKNDTLSETAGYATAWTSSILYGSGSGWLSISPASGSLAANGTAAISVSCTTGSLSAGTYTATITYSATTGGSTATISVTFVVSSSSAAKYSFASYS